MYLDDNGNVDTSKSRFGHCRFRSAWNGQQVHGAPDTAACPGSVCYSLPSSRRAMASSSATTSRSTCNRGRINCAETSRPARIYKADGSAYEAGERLVQSDLATLELIAERVGCLL